MQIKVSLPQYGLNKSWNSTHEKVRNMAINRYPYMIPTTSTAISTFCWRSQWGLATDGRRRVDCVFVVGYFIWIEPPPFDEDRKNTEEFEVIEWVFLVIWWRTASSFSTAFSPLYLPLTFLKAMKNALLTSSNIEKKVKKKESKTHSAGMRSREEYWEMLINPTFPWTSYICNCPRGTHWLFESSLHSR